MRTLNFNTVDVFTTRPFCGNSLAIVHRADELNDQQMQMIAREFNLPETIFIQEPGDSANTAKVRIFTPVDEIPFAGHPTIGCAIFLAEQHHAEKSTDARSAERIDGNDNSTEFGDDFKMEIKLEEVAGLVPVQVERKQGQISAQFTAPVIPTPSKPVDHNSEVTLDAAAMAIGLPISDIDVENSPPMSHIGGPTFLFVALNNRQALSRAQAAEPLCSQLTQACGATGLYVYYLDEKNNEVDARMFAPAAGIPEDPATGSATALLASHLLESKQLIDGINQFKLRQGYDMGRPSDLALSIELEQGSIKAVKVSGSSTNISAGNIRIPD